MCVCVCVCVEFGRLFTRNRYAVATVQSVELLLCAVCDSGNGSMHGRRFSPNQSMINWTVVGQLS